MNKQNFIKNLDEFLPFWERANAGVRKLALPSSNRTVLYFDTIDIATPPFFELIRSMLAYQGASAFVVLAVSPDPFTYFHHHFGKYPAFVLGPEHDEDDYYAFLHADPGGSPADALVYNAQRYAVLPTQGDWFIYGNWTRETGALIGSPEVMEFASQHYLFFQERDDDFRIVD